MCGITAIYGNLKDIDFRIKRSLDLVKHRGYSLYEQKSFKKCGLGCNRLQIVDREKGEQPATNEDKTIFAVLNGEIFNHKQLKIDLEKKGHVFKTNNDTEVLTHLYEEYKEKMVKKIDSEMFSFFIYDKRKDKFFVARDPYGVKPLYYALDKKRNYYFASEIKQLAQFKEIDKIEIFPPGHFMKNKELKKYHFIPRENLKISKQDAIKKIRTLFDEAVRKRVDTDLPVGVFFSGGIDSSAVLVTARKYHKNITAIIGGEDNSTDVVTALKYCKTEGIKYIRVRPPKEEDLVQIIPKIVKITESFEPNMVRQSAVAYYFSEVAQKKGFKIILCGEGPDELFAGYPEFKKFKDTKSISRRIKLFIKDLHRTQFQRVDRTSMAFTLEVRTPFFDTQFADYSLKIPSKYKIKKTGNKIIEKWILREAMKDRLPAYIYNRPKVVLSEGAGYKGNQPIGGLLYDLIKNKVSNKEFNKIKQENKNWPIINKEIAYYFKYFKNNRYTKVQSNKIRPIANAINSQDNRIEDFLKSLLNLNFIDKKETKKFNKIEDFRDSINNISEIKIVGYWGVEKGNVNEEDINLLFNLKILRDKFLSIYKKVEMVLILTDIHGSLNKIDESTIKEYYSLIKKFAKEYQFKTIFLSKIWGTKNYLLESQKINSEEESMELLIKSAQKHYFGKNKNFGAEMYGKISLIDSKKVKEKYPNSIFFTHNSSDWKNMLPTLPTIVLWGNEKGSRLKPWHQKL